MAHSGIERKQKEVAAARSLAKGERQPSTAVAPAPSFTRREAIRTEAARIFAKRGYHGAALQEIADGMGFTKASIYYYYRSKEDLLFDILSFADLEINALLDTEITRYRDPIERVGRIVAAHVTWYLRHPDIAKVAFRDWGELSGEELAAQLERRRKLSYLLRDSIEACRVAGLSPPGANVTLMANFINGAVAATNLWFNPEGPDQPDVVGRAFGDMAISIVRLGHYSAASGKAGA